MQATLVARGWLRREVEVRTDSAVFQVAYNGRGIGYEEVLVGGLVTVKRKSWRWFVPRFEFAFGPHVAIIEVCVWPWLTIRGLRLAVDQIELYSEGAFRSA